MASKVLVTGADGFIGSHLTEALVKRGDKVKALVCYNSFDTWGWLDHIPKQVQEAIEIIPGDIRDERSVRTAMEGCSTVYHLAALIAIPFSYQAPRLYVDTNVHGTVNVLEAALSLGVRRVLQTSTSEVYGSAQQIPIDEKHPLVGQSPYAASKIAADQMALAYHRSFGLPVVVVRPFNTYGPRQSNRAVIPTIIAQIASGENKIRLGNVNTTRDFNFVADTVSGFMAAASADEGCLGECFNLGTGFEIKIGDLVKTVAEIMDREISVEPEEQRLRPDKSEVLRLVADANKAKQRLGWRADFAGEWGLRQGLTETIAWFKNPANLAFYKTSRYTV